MHLNKFKRLNNFANLQNSPPGGPAQHVEWRLQWKVLDLELLLITLYMHHPSTSWFTLLLVVCVTIPTLPNQALLACTNGRKTSLMHVQLDNHKDIKFYYANEYFPTGACKRNIITKSPLRILRASMIMRSMVVERFRFDLHHRNQGETLVVNTGVNKPPISGHRPIRSSNLAQQQQWSFNWT